jgi:hypothetical protein
VLSGLVVLSVVFEIEHLPFRYRPAANQNFDHFDADAHRAVDNVSDWGFHSTDLVDSSGFLATVYQLASEVVSLFEDICVFVAS